MGFLGSVIVRGFGEINETVSTTLVVLLITDERDTKTDIATLANTGGNETLATVSKAARLMSKVVITRSFLAATADDGRMSPRTVQTTSELDAAKPEALTVMLKKGLL